MRAALWLRGAGIRGGRAGGVRALLGAAPLLALAVEGVQAREARRGHGRIAETVEGLVRRLGAA
ncbi:hypothetical protein [Deinococcus multiflagellatus]|uniref:Uncharacterized protein n=1 Tax=Deinococcus multiflagellatus TaxID=1656887 RepID=A0ABW1ZJ96_9DEIO